jgi:DNA sulfur modification protein DndD
VIIRSILLENFGLYAGTQRLDLVPRKLPDRETPVVLVGGGNGAGKTTLLEAVRLALYGRRALGFRVAQSEYEEHLRSRVHVDAAGRQAGVAAVGLEFDYAEAGVVARYRVHRSWLGKGSKVVETLTLEKDGAPVTSVPRDEWHHFLQELIPPGVSQLFFFDGEKISEIAQGDPDEGLAEAVRGLLGIELVGRLRTDLGLFLARRSKDDSGQTAARLEACERDLAVLDRKIEETSEEVAELRSRHAGSSREAYNVRQRFVAEGGDAANKRASLEASREELRHQIARRETELKELAGGLLPFAVAPKLIGKFKAALTAAQDRELGPIELKRLMDKLEDWRSLGSPPRGAAWEEQHWTDLQSFLNQTAGPIGNPALSKLDPGERRALLDRLSEVGTVTAARAQVLVSELDGLATRLREVEANLVRAEGRAAGIILDELVLAEQQVGATEAQLKAKSEELRVLIFRRATLDREQKRILKEQAEEGASKGRAELAARVSHALLQYEEKLLGLKLQQLQREFVGCFNHLARKDGFVAEVRVDPSSFEATLIDVNGREIPKGSLSAGEKQVYAIAMLWALARTSGRALPMIIDTPLARLDSEHRTALVERYFPEASHQVIVLSTDTEVDDQLLAKLSPSVSHAYRLDYEPLTRSTVVRPGYFNKGNGEERDALQQA